MYLLNFDQDVVHKLVKALLLNEYWYYNLQTTTNR